MTTLFKGISTTISKASWHMVLLSTLCLSSQYPSHAQVQTNPVPVKPAKVMAPSPEKQLNKSTAQAMSTVPGVKVTAQDFDTPSMPPIKGFHPIRRALRPVQDLEGMSLQLEQQIMRLEGPIAALQTPMLGLHNKMTHVENSMGSMQGQLGQVDQRVNKVELQISGVRDDLEAMRKQIGQLEEPIVELKGPLSGIAGPLSGLEKQLDRVQALIASILLDILIASIAIAVGTPIAAILIYRNRKKLFPDMKDSEFPANGDMSNLGHEAEKTSINK